MAKKTQKRGNQSRGFDSTNPNAKGLLRDLLDDLQRKFKGAASWSVDLNNANGGLVVTISISQEQEASIEVPSEPVEVQPVEPAEAATDVSDSA